MGILAEPLAFLRELPLKAGFSVCELGDQYITCVTPHQLARTFYESLGCSRYESIDANGRGTLALDLNRKLTQSIGRFDLVTDFGTGEHVFDQAQVWKTIHVLTKPGGFIAFDRPTDGYPGHAFYRIDPCVVEDIAEANDYQIIKLETADTVRGKLVRGVFRRPKDLRLANRKFQVPYQGRYQKSKAIA